jgi:uncharacterized membrane protein
MLGGALKRGAPVGLAAAGLLLSLALELLHVRAYSAPASSSFCTLGAHLDCTSVALSRYAVLLGLPLPLWGALGFLALGSAAYRRSWWLLPLAAMAGAVSIALLIVELALVGALCLLCEGVHVVALATLALAWRRRAELVPRSRDDAAIILLPPLGAMLALLLFLPKYWGAFGWRGELPFPDGVTADGAHWIGAREPQLTVDEYIDYLCPHCKAATAWTLKRLAAKPNDIRIVRRHFPLGHCRAEQKTSCVQLRMAYCAGEQQRFWQMDRWLFAHQELRPSLDAASRDVALDVGRFATCVERSDTYEHAERESRDATKKRFVGTPTYMVGGKRVSAADLDRLLEQGRID